MTQKPRSSARKATWAYGYEIIPPQSRERLGVIRAVLDAGHSDARLGARSWEGRLVLEERVTHILVVSDSPDQDLDVNFRIEAELKKLEVGFSITVPLTVASAENGVPEKQPPARG